MSICEISLEQTEHVSGGFFGHGWASSSRIGAHLGATAGYKAGVYNLVHDVFHGANPKTIIQDLINIPTYMHTGAKIGSDGIFSGKNLLHTTVNAIHNAKKYHVSVDFPPMS